LPRPAAEAELAFHCPQCQHALGSHDTYSPQALAAAASPARAAAAAADAAGAGALQREQQPRAGSLPAMPTLQQEGNGGGGSGAARWQSSAKLDALMDLLRTLRDKGAAGAARPPLNAR
jgi:hypothetical protein